jgi:hypothetical protein
VAEPQVNYEDDFTVEDETVLSRLEARDRADSLSPEDLYKAGAWTGMMIPSAGFADYFGQYPNPEKSGSFLPSFSKNVDQGEYFNAAMQFLGAAGDATYTIPGIGALTGTALKTLALGGKLSKVQLSKIMDGIGAYMPKIEDPMLATAGGPFIQRSPEIDTSTTKIIASEEALGGGEKIAKHIELSSSKKKKQDIFKENKSFVDPLDNKISFEISTKSANLLDKSVGETNKGFIGSHFLKPNPNQEYGMYRLNEVLTGMDDLFKQYPDLNDAYVQPFNGVVEKNGRLIQSGAAVTSTDLIDKALFSPEMVYSDAKKEWDKEKNMVKNPVLIH